MPPRHDRRRRDRLLMACTMLCTIGAIITVAVGAPSILATRHEAQIRQDQFCALILRLHNNAVNDQQDRVGRLNATLEYLQTDAGRERTGLNETIRKRSVPTLRGDVANGTKKLQKEAAALPPVCVNALPPVQQQQIREQAKPVT